MDDVIEIDRALEPLLSPILSKAQSGSNRFNAEIQDDLTSATQNHLDSNDPDLDAFIHQMEIIRTEKKKESDRLIDEFTDKMIAAGFEATQEDRSQLMRVTNNTLNSINRVTSEVM